MAKTKTEKTEGLNLYQKLLEIQKHIIGLGKDKAAYGYKYVTGDKVLEHIKPLMNEYGLLLKQEVLSIENVRQDYKVRNGETSEINSKVMMRFTWVDCATGDRDENLFGANGQNAWDKGVGSALTYGERYFLLKFFHIATDEDDIDNPDRKPQEQEKAPQKAAKPVEKPSADFSDEQKEMGTAGMATEVQKNKILELIEDGRITAAEKKKALDSLDTLNMGQAVKFTNRLKDLIAEREGNA